MRSGYFRKFCIHPCRKNRKKRESRLKENLFIHRLGFPEGQYTQYTYLLLMYETEDGPWSMDAAVLERLCEKERTMLQAIDNQVLEIQPTSEEDLELIFGKLRI